MTAAAGEPLGCAQKGRPTARVGFVSTRIAGTDGVSLEIGKWAEVLERNGFRCYYLAGELDRPEDRSFFEASAHFEHPAIQEIQRDVFGKRVRRRATSEAVQRWKETLKEALYAFRDRFSLDLLVAENALAIPMNLPLGLALTEFIAETGIPTIGHHHDFFWERDRFLVNACQDYLDAAFPPDLPSIRHVVINSLASEQLSHRRGLSNTLIPNVLDFAHEPPPCDGYCEGLRGRIGLAPDDLFVLQPTRVVPRKWIERSIEIVHHLNPPRRRLVISHASGDEGDDYYLRVQEYARHLGVEILPIDRLIAPRRGTDAQGNPLYTIADVYRSADLVTYPSGYEGFGNAFLEAIYYKKPVVVNRYSTYVTDIEPKEFDVIRMDGFIGAAALAQIREILSNPERREAMVRTNYEKARRYFSYEVLEERLLAVVRDACGDGP
ncbi:MAG: glycosyltransferase family 4 protein [Deferrisomatales bacterium]